MVEAAGSAVPAFRLTPAVSAACRLAAVAAGVAPMANWLGPGGVGGRLQRQRLALEPSGRVKP